MWVRLQELYIEKLVERSLPDANNATTKRAALTYDDVGASCQTVEPRYLFACLCLGASTVSPVTSTPHSMAQQRWSEQPAGQLKIPAPTLLTQPIVTVVQLNARLQSLASHGQLRTFHCLSVLLRCQGVVAVLGGRSVPFWGPLLVFGAVFVFPV